MDRADIENRFEYHPPKDEETKNSHARVREVLVEVALELDGLVPEGRELSLAITKLEEAMMLANAGIARHPKVEEDEVV
jgi:hypothetical protein